LLITHMEHENLSSIIDRFPLSHTHRRFLCGASALRDTRRVSRMQLYLAMSGLDDTDVVAQLLVSDIRKYESASAFLLSKKRLTIKGLLKAHGKLLPDDKYSGKLRTNQNWIGKSRKSATYIPPSSEKLTPLLNDFLATFNSQDRFSTEEVIKLYCQFLTIHPFRDGNGRISRVLIDYMQQKSDLRVHFSLFRLGMNISDYQEAVLSFGVRSNLGLGSPYWQKMIAWVGEYETKTHLLLKELHAVLMTKLALSPLNKTDLKMIGLLLKQPIVSLSTAPQMLGVDFNTAKESLSRLVATDVLKPYKTKNKANSEVLVCRDICQFTMKLDELLFSDKGL